MGARGRLITFEGMEGAGKSTNLSVVRRLVEAHLASRPSPSQANLLVTREPGGTPLAEEIRELLLAVREEPVTATAEVLLMFAARAQHVENFVAPALAAGHWVLSDRFTDASFAYQGGGRELDWSLIERLEAATVGGLEPDLTIFLDLDWEEAMARIQGRPLDRFEQEARSFFERVRKGYQARLESSDRFLVIDASAPLAVVKARIETLVGERLAAWETVDHG